MPSKSAEKGKRYERKIAKWYRDQFGLDTERGWQRRLGHKHNDVEIGEGLGVALCIECKHYEKNFTTIYTALQQAMQVMQTGLEVPVVHFKDDNRGDMVAVRLTDWKFLLDTVKRMEASTS